MITAQKFLDVFIKPLAEYFGETNFPKARNQALFEILGGHPEAVLRKASTRIIAKYAPRICPDSDKMLEIVIQTGSSMHRDDSGDRKRLPFGCDVCKGDGKKVINNTAYRCSCELGKTLYPHWAEYNQQSQFVEKVWEKDGMIFTETDKVIYRRPKFGGSLSEYGIILKDEEKPAQKPKRHEYE
jgi:hypothetical protein